MSKHVIHVKSCQLCQIMSFMSNHAIHDFSRNSVKSGGQGRGGEGGGQIGLPKPSATASLSGRRQKYLTTASNRLLAGDQHTGNCKATKTFSGLG
jgi:hypothetical protein